MKKYYVTIVALLTLIITFSFIYNPFIPLLTKPDPPAYKYNHILEEQERENMTDEQVIENMKIRKITISFSPSLRNLSLYYAEFNNNGMLHWTTKFPVDTLNHVSKYSKSLFIEICDYIEFAKIGDLKEYYLPPGECHQSIQVTIYYKDGTQKNIKDYCFTAPVQFKFLETHLEYLIDRMRWKKIIEEK